MELDLNVAEVAPEKPAAAMEASDSGSSESSVLNAEAASASAGAAAPAEEGSSSTPAVLEFSILRSDSDAAGADDDDDATPSPPPHHHQHHHHQHHHQQQLVTRELFPAGTGPPLPSPQHWAELGFFRADPPRPHQQQPDIRILPHPHQHPHATPPVAPPPPVQPQPAKKSRRGPRSRSSQYRGVTFYRRTGRWESHIWSVTCTRSPPAVHAFELSSFFLLWCSRHYASNLHFLLHFMLISLSLSLSLVSLAGIVGSRCTWVSSCPIEKN